MAVDQSILHGKKILLGISGSIAAYKSAFLTRLLVTAGAEVRVVMTKDAMEFITPLTLATLSKHPVESEFVADSEKGIWNNHVELGLWADCILIAPATSNTLSKINTGECDNLLLATVMSARCPVLVAPAMDLDMYTHPATTENLIALKQKGIQVIDPGTGELASGLSGKGRMEEPEKLVELLAQQFLDRAPLHGKTALVTAGPTHEAIDAVRFIGNHSTGKMGFAIAEELATLGADVKLISGPTLLETKHPGIERTKVKSAEDMKMACEQYIDATDILVMSAAVADYRPKHVAANKMKKKDADLSIELEPTPDILKSLGERKKEGQIYVGFALETDNEIEHAKRKLERKNLDMIVLNSLNDKGAGFGHDTNKVTILRRGNKMANFELKSKVEVAKDIVGSILALYEKEK